MIYQGSNLPVLLRNFPVEPKDISVTINHQGSEIKHWGLEDVRIEDGYIICPLTQTETLNFPKGMCVITVKMTDHNGAICYPVEIPTYIVGRKDLTILEGEEAQYSAVIDYDLAEIEAETGKIIIKVDVKKEDIETALGYTPYGKPKTGIPETDLSDEVQKKLNQSGGEGKVKDVTIKGTSIVDKDGTAIIPLVANGKPGLADTSSTYGTTVKVGCVAISSYLERNGYPHGNPYKPIVADNLYHAMENVLGAPIGTKGINEDGEYCYPDWTDEEKENALIRTGAKEEIRKLIPKPEDAPVVGKILKVKSVNEDGTFVCEWGDAPSGGISDVKIGDDSIVTDGVANIPQAKESGKIGTILVASTGQGLAFRSDGGLYVMAAKEADINGRNINRAIVTTNLNYAVTAVLTDGKAPTLTEQQQASAHSWLGIYPMSEEGY